MNAILLSTLALVPFASAQSSDQEIRAKILRVKYPPIARAARVIGDVRLTVDSEGITPSSGHPLLRQAAIDSAHSLGLRPGITLTYHFVLSGTVTTVAESMTVLKGDALDRLFLRILHLKTEKIVIYRHCVTVDEPNDVQVSQDFVEVWINAGPPCLETETSYVLTQLPIWKDHS